MSLQRIKGLGRKKSIYKHQQVLNDIMRHHSAPRRMAKTKSRDSIRMQGKCISSTLLVGPSNGFALSFCYDYILLGISRWLSNKEPTCQCRRCRFYPWVRKIPWSRKWLPTPVFLPAKSHGHTSLAGYNPWGCKESNMTEQLHNNNKNECCCGLNVPYVLLTAHLLIGILIVSSLGLLEIQLLWALLSGFLYKLSFSCLE